MRDGGSPIEGYIIEKKVLEGNWAPVNSAPVKSLNFTLTDVQEDDQMELRVRAVTEAGPGKPSEPVNAVAQYKEGPPKVDLNSLKNITVRAGEEFDLRLLYRGFPKPTAEWSRSDLKGETVANIADSDSRFYNQVARDNVLLHCSKAERKDTGSYKLKLKNRFGEENVSCRVTVLGK